MPIPRNITRTCTTGAIKHRLNILGNPEQLINIVFLIRLAIYISIFPFWRSMRRAITAGFDPTGGYTYNVDITIRPLGPACPAADAVPDL